LRKCGDWYPGAFYILDLKRIAAVDIFGVYKMMKTMRYNCKYLQVNNIKWGGK